MSSYVALCRQRPQLQADIVALLALLIRRDAPEALDRLGFLAALPSERPDVSLSTALGETKAGFLRVCPAYRRWDSHRVYMCGVW